MSNTETKTELYALIDSIDNPKILQNLRIIVADYIAFTNQRQKNEAD